jgi:Protein kinase domain
MQRAMIIAGKYEVLGRLGQGGQGFVYKVRHLGLDEIRALKVQPDQGGDETVTRFRREGRALARLRHQHIVQVFDLGRHDDQYYLEMEYVDGPNLAQHLKANGRPPVLDALEIARQIADALTYAHAQPYVDSAGVQHTGMVHRDIKPSNILLRAQTPIHALLADFGLVKLGDPGERTTTGTMLGTYKYSAPEQLGLKRGRVRVPVDFRADIFAFGLVLYELLEGRQFHAGLEPQEILARVLFEPDALEPEFTVSVLPGLRALLRRMIQRDPEHRPASMRLVLSGIDEALQDLRGGDETTVVVPPGGRPAEAPGSDDELEARIRALVEERERRRAQTARSEAETARARALEAGAVELATADFEAAVRREEEASFALSAGNLTEARELYELTSRLFAEAASHAASARERHAADEARAAAHAAREAAQEAGALELAAALWTGAAEQAAAADAQLAAGDVLGARRAFEGAATSFRAARSAAQTERERRRAQAQAAERAAADARTEAEAAATAHHAPQAWREALDAFADGERRAHGGDDLGAVASFRRAADAFADATQRSLVAQAQAAAAEARSAADAAEAAGAGEHAAGEYAAAREQLEAAAATLARGDAAGARRLFADAAAALSTVASQAALRRRRKEEEEARRRAAEEEARRRAAEERQKLLAAAEDARAATNAAAARARAAEAPVLAASSWAAAETKRADAEAALSRDALAEGAALLVAAGAAFDEAARVAEREAARRRTVAARSAAAAARENAAAAQAERWAAPLSAEAERLWRGGEDAMAREAFGEGERCFTEATRAFERAIVEARERAAEARRREEEEARRRAEEEARRRAAEDRARQLAAVEEERKAAAVAAGQAEDLRAGDLAAPLFAAAVAKHDEAEDALRREALPDAARAFAAARAAFEAAASAAVVEASRRRALAARDRAAAAHREASAAEVTRWAPELEAEAERLRSAGDDALARDAFGDADRLLVDAAGAFERATAAAIARAEEARRREEEERLRREAEAARRRAEEESRRVAEERARQLAAVEKARTAAAEAAERARVAAAADLARPLLSAATNRQSDAEAAMRREAFADAARLFTEAGTAFDEAADAAIAAARRRAEEEARRRAAEEAEAHRKAEEEAKRQAAEESKRRAEVEARRRAAEEAEARRKAEAEAKRRAEAEARQRAAEEAEARRKAEEEAKRQAAEEAKRRAEAEARRRAAEEAEARRKAEEEAKRQAEAEASRQAELEATRAAEAEHAMLGTDDATVIAARGDDATMIVTPVDEATVIAPPPADQRPTPPPPQVASVPSLPVEEPARARWPYAAAAVLAIAVGLGYALWPSHHEAERVPTEAPRQEPEKMPETKPETKREAPETPPPTLPALAWQEVVPARGETPSVKEGERLRFEASVAAADSQPGLDVRWLLDGREVGQGSSWEYAPGFDEGGHTRSVEAVATSEGRRIEQGWKVTVTDVDRPPVIASVSPPVGTVALARGTSQKFALQATDPDEGDHLTYVWERNGKRVASGAQPDLTVRDAADGDEIRVTVTDQAGASAGTRSWKLALAPPPPIEPPKIVAQTPSPKGRLSVEEGKAIDFGLRVTSQDPNEKLAYAWFVDGRPVGTGKTLRYEAPSLAETKSSQRVEAEVTNGAGKKSDRVGWDVDVQWAPPVVARLEPRDRAITLEPGQTRTLRAGATSPAKGALSYEWRLDGKAQQPSPSGRFELPTDLPTGSHAVEVASIDARGLRSDPLTWTVDVRPSPPPTVAPPATLAPPPTVAIPSTTPSTSPPAAVATRGTTPPPAGGPLTQAEVRDWLARYRSAWERKDAAALASLGVTSDDRARDLVSKIGYLRQVRVGNETVSPDGTGATVSFDRTDVADNGKELQHPRKSCHLERVGGAVVARGGCL